jgi:bacteriocin-like protein
MSDKESKDKEQKPKEPLKDVTGEEISEETLKNVSGGRARAEECATGNASALKAL